MDRDKLKTELQTKPAKFPSFINAIGEHVMSRSRNLNLLMELRPAMAGFAGIPQETRLLYSLYHDLPGVTTTGLINHSSLALSPALTRPQTRPSNTLTERERDILSRHIKSHEAPGPTDLPNRLRHVLKRRKQKVHRRAQAVMGVPHKLTYFQPVNFQDFIWQTFFSKTLPESELDKATRGDFAVLSAPYAEMHGTRLVGLPYPRMSTDNYDIFVAQTPWPSRVSPRTQLVVRYHDAVPIFHPHTIMDKSFHQSSHMAALRENQKSGVFACTSEATRQDLLKIFPNLEERSVVIPDIVSHCYFEQSASPERRADIIRNHIEPSTEPNWPDTHKRAKFYNTRVNPKSLRYIMMVSTIEPRKNHMVLIAAWDRLRAKVGGNLKLIIVGSPGWSSEAVIDAMRPWQEKGDLFNLSKVPPDSLRALFNGAEAVICPSVCEGFDLSGIEAMLSGGPVVASDIPVHREVYADASEYFDPYCEEALADAMERVIVKPAYSRALIARGLQQGRKFTRESIGPQWEVFFDRVRAGEFDRARGKSKTRDVATSRHVEGVYSGPVTETTI